ncbi:hypothetical protein [Tessaracoccus flavescens]|uniref:Lipoprotein n=1 Tax=Tessaracoccus flavescens TaxID=399497 RepID=A0A1Q2CZ37_9ACTN|nr:hypothetical protein [Tessaracoccus flavescens]AQP51406.1 hypothetical protein BW733_11845 [Tessaracoccus flavescens]
MKLTRVIPAVAAVALLGACSPMPGTAAVLDGKTYSHADVDRMADACNKVLGADSLNGQFVMTSLVGGFLFEKVAEAAGAEIPDEQIDAMLVQSVDGAQALLDEEDCAPVMRAYAKSANLAQLDQAAVQSVAQDADVELNPRYGRWDPNAASLLAQSGSLSVPAAEQAQQ